MYTLITLHSSGLRVSTFKTQNECFNFVQNNSCIKYKVYSPNEKRDITFLNALIWSDLESNFVIDILKAKEIKKNLLRQTRAILFQKLDAAFLKSLESGDEQRKQYLINLKNQFRDVTDLELPNVEKELLDFMPTVFKEVYDLSV
jgi:hypothetical protein